MQPFPQPDSQIAQRLNQHCHCVGVDRQQLEGSLFQGMADADLVRSLKETHQHLFSSSPVFVAESHLLTMQRTVDAIERLAASTAFREHVDERLRAAGLEPPTAAPEALLSYDFHIAADGPRLIEVNTNPGGVLLGLHIQAAQEACCAEVERAHHPLATQQAMEATLLAMVAEAGDQPRPNVAIVDEQPEQQFLQPEFVLYRQLFERHGLSTRILDPRAVQFDGDRLHHDGWPIDVVYKRSTDFLLQQPQSADLRAAWEAARVAMTPDPVAWSRYADKSNLITLSDPAALQRYGVNETHRELLQQTVPTAHLLNSDTAEQLWLQRKQFFFKPMAGHGSRGTYDGKKISRRKFNDIAESGYIAQERIPPSERTLLLDEQEVRLKLDLRCITWQGRILMLMARMYRGQTTNMRTEGGGLATALVFNAESVPA